MNDKVEIVGLKELAEDVAGSANVYLSDTMQTVFNNMNAMMHRDHLLTAKPEKLNAPVYQEIDRSIIGWSSERPLEKHIAELTRIAAKAPKGCKVVIEFDQESDYEGGYDTMRRIGFYRPPTAEEVEERKARNAEIREVHAEASAEAEKREREEFKRLQEKFGSDSDGSGEAGQTA